MTTSECRHLQSADLLTDDLINNQVKQTILTHPYFTNCIQRDNAFIYDSLLKYRKKFNITNDSILKASVIYMPPSCAHDIDTKIVSVYNDKKECFTIPLIDNYYYLIKAQNYKTSNCKNDEIIDDCFLFKNNINYILDNSIYFKIRNSDTVYLRERIYELIDFLLINILNKNLITKKDIEKGYLDEYTRSYYSSQNLTLRQNKMINDNNKRILENINDINYRYYSNFQAIYEIILFKKQDGRYNIELELLNKEYYYFPRW